MYSVCIYVDLHVTLSIDSIQNYREEAKKQRQLIQALERERDRYGKDAADAQQGCISQVQCRVYVQAFLLSPIGLFSIENIINTV